MIQSDQANAFCLPGGKMAVYTGLIPVAQNQNAMAVVMGHEIAHALLRHGAQRMSQQKLTQIGQMAGAMSGMDPQQQQMVMAAMGYGYLLPYAREHETQADEVGLMLAAAACFDPREAVPLWQKTEEELGEMGLRIKSLKEQEQQPWRTTNRPPKIYAKPIRPEGRPKRREPSAKRSAIGLEGWRCCQFYGER